MMNPKLNLEDKTETDNKLQTAYSRPMKKFCLPLDLSRRDSVDSVHTSSLYSEKINSSVENSPSYSNDAQNTPTPDSGKEFFRTYPNNPFCTSPLSPLDAQIEQQFQIFRLNMLEKMRNERGGQIATSNPKMRRHSNGHAESSGVSDLSNSGVRDYEYYQKRAKNNVAAKASRDRRRLREEETAIRTMFLEQTNMELKASLAAARNEIAELKCQLAKK